MTKFFKLAIFIVLWTGLSACFETQSERYANHQSAEADGAFVRGWLPRWLPRNVINISERHNLDTNRMTAKFDFDGEDSFQLPDHCNTQNRMSPPIYFKSDFKRLLNAGHPVYICGPFHLILAPKEGMIWIA